MGGWGTSNHGLKSKKECEDFVKSFCRNEDSNEKGVKFHDRRFKTLDEAEAFASENDDKWGDAVAVSYYAVPEKVKVTKSSKRIDVIKDKEIPDLNKKLSLAIEELSQSVERPELEIIKCDYCHSKVNVKYLNMPILRVVINDIGKPIELECPVCNTKGIVPKCTKEALKSLVKIKNDIVKLKEEWSKLKEVVREENELELMWAVSVSVPS